ncbi:hypothetical protein N8J89_27285 [Crossiella sp. CA-258035]|uniref:hypothetical protein n=1 Tax=Crossiella sp. CA-258035 TaxID=2981138 RepID=UPI0024BBFF9D|nr:hypothetical protein [Crossiella sp. CA-258035]WHT16825.1 hypothetical protein N8J89_27285 [Crossiella sp. CA-258035]
MTQPAAQAAPPGIVTVAAVLFAVPAVVSLGVALLTLAISDNRLLYSLVALVAILLAGLLLLWLTRAFHRGRNWARVVITVYTVLFVLYRLTHLLRGLPVPASDLLPELGLLAIATLPVVLAWRPEANRYFAR